MVDDDALSSLAARRGPAGSVDPGPCPDANLLAAHGAGRLAVADRDAVEAHAARCGDCAAALAALADPDVLPALAQRPAGRVLGLPRRWAWAAAAVLLVAVGVVVWAPRAGERSASGSAESVRIAFARLAERDPAWRDLRPLGEEELAQPAEVMRGGVEMGEPAGTVLSDRPRFAWTEVPGAGKYEVRVVNGNGHAVVLLAVSRTWWEPAPQDPALERGRSYGWRVVARGAAGPVEGTRAFAVASAEEVAAWEKARAAIEGLGPDVPRALVTAHAALRRGLWLEAERAAEEYLRAHPEDDYGARTLRRARALLGRPPDATSRGPK